MFRHFTSTSDTKIARINVRQDLAMKNSYQPDYYSYSNIVSSIAVINLMPEIIAVVLREVTWPKSMRWRNYKINWVRPFKNITCIFDDNNTAETGGAQ